MVRTAATPCTIRRSPHSLAAAAVRAIVTQAPRGRMPFRPGAVPTRVTPNPWRAAIVRSTHAESVTAASARLVARKRNRPVAPTVPEAVWLTVTTWLPPTDNVADAGLVVHAPTAPAAHPLAAKE